MASAGGARAALAAAERAHAAVAVVDDAMVAEATSACGDDDPTAHAVIVALRETARKLAGAAGRRDDLRHREPCVMCMGALLESDVAALVFAAPNRTPRAGSVIHWPTTGPPAPGSGGERHPPRRGRGTSSSRAAGDARLIPAPGAGPRRAGPRLVSSPRRGVEWLMVPALEKRSAQAAWVRIHLSARLAHPGPAGAPTGRSCFPGGEVA